MGSGKYYFTFFPQSWIDIFVLWYLIKMKFFWLFCNIVIEQNKLYRLIPQIKYKPTI
jgi:hypothetical protein